MIIHPGVLKTLFPEPPEDPLSPFPAKTLRISLPLKEGGEDIHIELVPKKSVRGIETKKYKRKKSTWQSPLPSPRDLERNSPPELPGATRVEGGWKTDKPLPYQGEWNPKKGRIILSPRLWCSLTRSTLP